jgi:hypothetical protein
VTPWCSSRLGLSLTISTSYERCATATPIHVAMNILTEDQLMKRIALALLITAFATGSAVAQSCATKAMSKEGKPLSGAAKTSTIKKCCEDSAVSKDGKPLFGAAKTSHVTKCMKDG